MPATVDEVHHLARGVSGHFTEHEIRLACLLELCDANLDRLQQLHGTDLSALIAVRDACTEAFMHQQAIDRRRVEAAREALQRASESFGYLATIPD